MQRGDDIDNDEIGMGVVKRAAERARRRWRRMWRSGWRVDMGKVLFALLTHFSPFFRLQGFCLKGEMT